MTSNLTYVMNARGLVFADLDDLDSYIAGPIICHFWNDRLICTCTFGPVFYPFCLFVASLLSLSASAASWLNTVFKVNLHFCRRFPDLTGEDNLTVFSYSGSVKSLE